MRNIDCDLLELLQGTGQNDQSHSNGTGQRQQYESANKWIQMLFSILRPVKKPKL